MRLVLASNNAKKLAELATLLAALPIELVSQGALGIAEAEEPHASFVENALAKARHAARAAGGAAIADDSGLCVDALGGAPGVGSAHYAQAVAAEGDREARRAAQDAANNALLLARLAGTGAAPAASVTTRWFSSPHSAAASPSWRRPRRTRTATARSPPARCSP